MSVTQTVEFPAPSGLTITAKLFAAGSDTVVASAAANEQTNRKGVYVAVYTDVPALTYQLCAIASAVAVTVDAVALTLTTATFQTVGMGLLDQSTNDKASLQLAYPQRTVIRGTVGLTNLTTSTFTVSALDIPASAPNQFWPRIIQFDLTTTTPGLQGVVTSILANTTGALPTFTVNTLPVAPASTDTFSIL